MVCMCGLLDNIPHYTFLFNLACAHKDGEKMYEAVTKLCTKEEKGRGSVVSWSYKWLVDSKFTELSVDEPKLHPCHDVGRTGPKVHSIHISFPPLSLP